MVRFFSGGPRHVPGHSSRPAQELFRREEQGSTSPVTRARLAEPRWHNPTRELDGYLFAPGRRRGTIADPVWLPVRATVAGLLEAAWLG